MKDFCKKFLGVALLAWYFGVRVPEAVLGYGVGMIVGPFDTEKECMTIRAEMAENLEGDKGVAISSCKVLGGVEI